MELEVRHLRLVVSIAEEGGLTRAASRLHLTQSALSHQLREMEERLGTPLYHRMNRRLVMTEAGRRLLHSAKQVLDRLQQAEEEVRRMGEGREGSLRISTQCYTCYHWLPPMLRKFREKFPSVHVEINLEATRRPIEALLAGKLDLAIVWGPVEESGLDLYPLFRDELFAVMSVNHRLAKRKYLRADDFASETLFVYSLGTPEEQKQGIYIFREVLTPAEVEPAQVLEIQLTEAMIEMISAGMGIGILAGWASAPYLKSRKLQAVPVTRGGLHRDWVAATLSTDPPPAHIVEFVRLMRDGTLKLSAETRKNRKR